MGDLVLFVLISIPALAFSIHYVRVYRTGAKKPVGPALVFVDKALAALVLTEFLALAVVLGGGLWQ